METSDLVQKAVLTNQSPSSEEYFQERLSACFSIDESQSYFKIQLGKIARLKTATDGVSPDCAAAGGPHSEKPLTEETVTASGNPSVEIRTLEDLRILLHVMVLSIFSNHDLTYI